MDYRENAQLLLAKEFVEYTNRNVFLTGKAGTGKTTFLHNLKKNTSKRMVVVAPTGVAAINAGGVTIHSFFQLSFAPAIPPSAKPLNQDAPTGGFQRKFSREKIKLIKCIDLLVIDEISMVRADILDAVDEVLRQYRNHYKPFGGVQLLMIGDLHQLSPVIKEGEWNILKQFYKSVYFFESLALKQSNPLTIELKEIFRQSDAEFISLLNKVRENKIDIQTIQMLNSRHKPDFSPDDDLGYINLTTHNANAFEMNQAKLGEISSDPHFFSASIEGEFPSYIFPTEEELELKPRSQVMFIKNDISPEKRYYNGKIGRITRIEEEVVYVQCQADPSEIAVGKVKWENIKYSLNDETREITEEIIGSFTQIPLKLAWAITIHKSQGLTFDKVIIDARAAFAYGQVYVALSRCRTFAGIVLSTPISQSGIKTDSTITQYSREAQHNEPGTDKLFESKYLFQKELILELFDFKLTKYRFDGLMKLVNENANILEDDFIANLRVNRKRWDEEGFLVSEKFKPQLISLMSPGLLPEENQALQERARQAASYFAKNIKSNMLPFLAHANIETDNKVIRKLLAASWEKLHHEVFIRLSCLEACLQGFNTLTYLKVRANADVDFHPSAKTKTRTQIHAPSGILHPELYLALKRWRDNLADENNIPTYMVLPHKSMIELTKKLPTSLPLLKNIKGIGQAKIKQFGNEIIDLINTYCADMKITHAQVVIPDIEKSVKLSPSQMSFEMFKAGKTIAEIAAIRQVTLETIEGHLASYIAQGELSITAVVTAEKLTAVAQFMRYHPEKTISEIKSALGDAVSWADLRFIKQHINRTSL